jgi:hypothetical protein
MAKIRKFTAFIAFTFCLLLVSAVKIYAQGYYVEEPRLFYGGLVAGGNFTQVDGDRYAGYHKVGVNVGAIVYAHIAPKLAASMEILFSQKGSRDNGAQFTVSNNYVITDYNIDLNYAEVPIMINYFDKRKSNFGVGLSYAQLISSNEKVETIEPLSGVVTPIPSFNQDNHPFKKMDLNVLVGGNIKLTGGLFLNVRFQYSIVPIRRDMHPELSRAPQHNNMYVLRLMYLFNK